MKHGLLPLETKLPPPRKDHSRQIIWSFRISLGLLIFAAWYSKCGGPLDVHIAKHYFTIDKQKLFTDIHIAPKAISKMPNGELMVVGRNGAAAWATAASGDGIILWNYEDRDEGVETKRSQWNGAVPLKNGNRLLCGEKLTDEDAKAGLVTIVSAKGELVDQQLLTPIKDLPWFAARFDHCFALEDNIVLIGDAQPKSGTPGSGGYYWIKKLDNNGGMQSETVLGLDELRSAKKTTSTSTESSFVTTLYNSADNFYVIRLSLRGELIAKRKIRGSRYVVLRPMESAHKTSVILVFETGVPIKTTRYILNQDLEDLEAPQAIEASSFDVSEGFGFTFPDNSLALFGRVQNAAASWVNDTGKDYSITPFSVSYPSYSFTDAVPIAADRFVGVRNSVGVHTNNQGLMLSWITLK